MFGVLVGLKLLVEKTAAFAESYDQAGATAGTGVTCYIDNDAARYAYIAGSSKKGVAGLLIDEVNFFGVCSRHSTVVRKSCIPCKPC